MKLRMILGHSNGTALDHFAPNGTLTSQLLLMGFPLVICVLLALTSQLFLCNGTLH